MKAFYLAWLVLMPFALFAQTAAPSLETNKVSVTAYDASGHVLRTGMGFIYDEVTVVCAYHDVRGASYIRVQSTESGGYTNRVSSYNERFDIAVLKPQEEMPESNILGSSDMLVPGDQVRFFSRDHDGWAERSGVIRDFSDPGDGYERIHLIPSEPEETFEASPLYNAAGKIIGWRSEVDTAISLDAIHHLVLEKTATVSLGEMTGLSKHWLFQIIPAGEAPLAPPAGSAMKLLMGKPPFAFHIRIPEAWIDQRHADTGRFLMRAAEPKSGVIVEIRMLNQNLQDLPLSIERLETLVFPDFVRTNVIPFSAGTEAGMLASYEDPSSSLELRSFYTQAGKNFCAVSVSFPGRYLREAEPLVEQIFSSFSTR